MTVRSEQKEALARHRAEKLPIRAPLCVKELTMTLRAFREVRAEKPDGTPGKIVKVVGYLDCHARIAGRLEPITARIDVEVPSPGGLIAEINEGISAAGRAFLDEVIKAHLALCKEKSTPPPREDGMRVLPSQRPLDLAKSERMRGVNAKKQSWKDAKKARDAAFFAASKAQREAAKAAGAPEPPNESSEEPPATEEGPEGGEA